MTKDEDLLSTFSFKSAISSYKEGIRNVENKDKERIHSIKDRRRKSSKDRIENMEQKQQATQLLSEYIATHSTQQSKNQLIDDILSFDLSGNEDNGDGNNDEKGIELLEFDDEINENTGKNDKRKINDLSTEDCIFKLKSLNVYHEIYVPINPFERWLKRARIDNVFSNAIWDFFQKNEEITRQENAKATIIKRPKRIKKIAPSKHEMSVSADVGQLALDVEKEIEDEKEKEKEKEREKEDKEKKANSNENENENDSEKEDSIKNDNYHIRVSSDDNIVESNPKSKRRGSAGGKNKKEKDNRKSKSQTRANQSKRKNSSVTPRDKEKTTKKKGKQKTARLRSNSISAGGKKPSKVNSKVNNKTKRKNSNIERNGRQRSNSKSKSKDGKNKNSDGNSKKKNPKMNHRNRSLTASDKKESGNQTKRGEKKSKTPSSGKKNNGKAMKSSYRSAMEVMDMVNAANAEREARARKRRKRLKTQNRTSKDSNDFKRGKGKKKKRGKHAKKMSIDDMAIKMIITKVTSSDIDTINENGNGNRNTATALANKAKNKNKSKNKSRARSTGASPRDKDKDKEDKDKNKGKSKQVSFNMHVEKSNIGGDFMLSPKTAHMMENPQRSSRFGYRFKFADDDDDEDEDDNESENDGPFDDTSSVSSVTSGTSGTSGVSGLSVTSGTSGTTVLSDSNINRWDGLSNYYIKNRDAYLKNPNDFIPMAILRLTGNNLLSNMNKKQRENFEKILLIVIKYTKYLYKIELNASGIDDELLDKILNILITRSTLHKKRFDLGINLNEKSENVKVTNIGKIYNLANDEYSKWLENMKFLSNDDGRDYVNELNEFNEFDFIYGPEELHIESNPKISSKGVTNVMNYISLDCPHLKILKCKNVNDLSTSLCAEFVSCLKKNNHIMKCSVNLRFRQDIQMLERYLQHNGNHWREMNALNRKKIKEEKNQAK